MSIQDNLMRDAILEAILRECKEIVVRKEHWEAVTLNVGIKCRGKEGGQRVFTLAHEETDD